MENEFLEEKELELRMYFFVPYNISPIQQAIQAGHASLEYVLRYGLTDELTNFLSNWKTWIILNGGTTNDEVDFDDIPKGTLNQIGDSLDKNDIKFSYFREPDLNHSLTALCFIVDERVFNKKDYPDFINYLIESKKEVAQLNGLYNYEDFKLKIMGKEELIEQFPDYYKYWVRSIGGIKNVFLRELLKDKKLA